MSVSTLPNSQHHLTFLQCIHSQPSSNVTAGSVPFKVSVPQRFRWHAFRLLIYSVYLSFRKGVRKWKRMSRALLNVCARRRKENGDLFWYWQCGNASDRKITSSSFNNWPFYVTECTRDKLYTCVTYNTSASLLPQNGMNYQKIKTKPKTSGLA